MNYRGNEIHYSGEKYLNSWLQMSLNTENSKELGNQLNTLKSQQGAMMRITVSSHFP